MRWKQTTPNVLVASGTAVSVRDHHHLTFLSFSSNSWSFSPGNPGDSSLISSWKCLTPASWNQLYREERAAVWLPSSDWQLSGLRLTCCWPRGVVFSCRISLCVFFFFVREEAGSWLSGCPTLEDGAAFLLMGQAWDSRGAVSAFTTIFHSLLCVWSCEQPCVYSCELSASTAYLSPCLVSPWLLGI